MQKTPWIRLNLFLNLRCSILAVFSPMDFHMMRTGDHHRYHDMFLHRPAAGSAISSRLLHGGEFFGSRNAAVSPEARRLYELLQRRQPTMQTFDFKGYSSGSGLRYLINHQTEMKSRMRTQLLSSCDHAKL